MNKKVKIFLIGTSTFALTCIISMTLTYIHTLLISGSVVIGALWGMWFSYYVIVENDK